LVRNKIKAFLLDDFTTMPVTCSPVCCSLFVVVVGVGISVGSPHSRPMCSRCPCSQLSRSNSFSASLPLSPPSSFSSMVLFVSCRLSCDPFRPLPLPLPPPFPLPLPPSFSSFISFISSSCSRPCSFSCPSSLSSSSSSFPPSWLVSSLFPSSWLSLVVLSLG
jgi:hypothetical protein